MIRIQENEDERGGGETKRVREEEKVRVRNKAGVRKMVITYPYPLQSPAIPTL